MRARRASIAVVYDLLLHAEAMSGSILNDVCNLGERQRYFRRPDGNFTEGHTGAGLADPCLGTFARITMDTSVNAVHGLTPPRV